MEHTQKIALATIIILAMFLGGIIVNRYAQSETKEDKKRFILVLVFAGITTLFHFYIKSLWNYMETINPDSPYNLTISLLSMIQYLLCSLVLLSMAAYKKKGWNNLKGLKNMFKRGTIGLAEGLLLGLIVGSIFFLPATLLSTNSLLEYEETNSAMRILLLLFFLTLGIGNGWIPEFKTAEEIAKEKANKYHSSPD